MKANFSKSLVINFVILGLLYSVTITFVRNVWYPGLLFIAMGGQTIFFIAISITFALLVLCFVVAQRVEKKLLRYNSLMVVTQYIVFAAFIFSSLINRPVYIVYNVGRFDAVSAIDIVDNSNSRFMKNFSGFFYYPHVIAAVRPADLKERNEILFSSLQGGADIAQIPEYYIPYAQAALEIRKKIISIETLYTFHRNNFALKTAVSSLAGNMNVKTSELGFMPLRCKDRDLSVLLQRSDSQIKAIMDVNPYPDN